MDKQEQEKQKECEDMATIRMKRGIQSDIETMPLLSGEMAVALDTGRVFVGTEEGTVPLGTGDMYATIYDPTKKEQDIFAYAVPAAEKGVAGGVATLDESGKIPRDFLPEYSGGGGSTATGKKAVRFVIGTSAAGWTEADCDYLCDGVDDQIEINAAIQALPSTGGEIKLLDGTYSITDSIDINTVKNMTFCGSGMYNTIIKRLYSVAQHSDKAMILFTFPSSKHCTFCDFTLDGNTKEGYTGDGVYAKYSVTHTTFRSVCFINHEYDALRIGQSDYTTISYCVFDNIGVKMVYAAQSNDVVISHCRMSNLMKDSTSSNGIYTYDNVRVKILYNFMKNAHCITLSGTDFQVIGNTIEYSEEHNNRHAIYADAIKNSVISNNVIKGGDWGIYVSANADKEATTVIVGNMIRDYNRVGILSSGGGQVITGNTCYRGTGTAQDYTSSQYTINVRGLSDKEKYPHSWTVVGNACYGKDITLDGDTTGAVVANNIT